MADVSDEDLIVLNSEERVFKCWASAEIPDAQKTTISIDFLKKQMLDFVMRGGAITLLHTAGVVSKVLTFGFGIHPKYNVEGIWVIGQVFKGTPNTEEAWAGLQRNGLQGRPKYVGLSIYGTMTNPDKNGFVEKFFIDSIGLTTELPGMKASNPAATMIAVSAARTDGGVQPASRPFAGYADFEACVKSNGDKQDPNAYCASIMQQVEGKKNDKGDIVEPDDKNKPAVAPPANTPPAAKQEQPPAPAPAAAPAQDPMQGMMALLVEIRDGQKALLEKLSSAAPVQGTEAAQTAPAAKTDAAPAQNMPSTPAPSQAAVPPVPQQPAARADGSTTTPRPPVSPGFVPSNDPKKDADTEIMDIAMGRKKADLFENSKRLLTNARKGRTGPASTN